MTWHKVQDILPPPYTDVLTYANCYSVGQYYGKENGGWALQAPTENIVTHWAWLLPFPK